jgi:hypothetical protein
MKTMGQERVVRREVHEAVVEDPEATPTTTTPSSTTRKGVPKVVEHETGGEETTETRAPASGVTNVNVNKDPVSGNVNVNTPDGTQVHINT